MPEANSLSADIRWLAQMFFDLTVCVAPVNVFLGRSFLFFTRKKRCEVLRWKNVVGCWCKKIFGAIYSNTVRCWRKKNILSYRFKHCQVHTHTDRFGQGSIKHRQVLTHTDRLRWWCLRRLAGFGLHRTWCVLAAGIAADSSRLWKIYKTKIKRAIEMSSFKFYSFVIFHHRDYERKARSRPRTNDWNLSDYRRMKEWVNDWMWEWRNKWMNGWVD